MQQLINQRAKILGYFHHGRWFPCIRKKPDEIRNQLQIGSLSNGVDDLENFTSEMEWSFFVPVGFSCVFSNWYSYVSTPPAFPLAWIHVWIPAVDSQRVRALRINGGCHATLDGNEGGNDRFSCICIVSFYSIAKIFCEYKKWCWKIIINTI